MDVTAYLRDLTDEQLQNEFDTAKRDLEIAATEHRNSELHDATFAALMMIAIEMSSRKNRNTLH